MRRWSIVTAVLMLGAGASYGAWRGALATRALSRELDRAAVLADLAPLPQATIVFDRQGRQAFSYFVEQRIDVPLDRVSPHMIDAVLTVEDRRFYSHHGLDPIRMARAAWRNFRAHRIVEGGSTITQQLARVSQLSPERTYARKIREVLLAASIEQRYTKQQILEQYLNTVYFGEGFYGVEAAARGYFGKSASDLAQGEAALLAALVRSPSNDAPCVAPDRAKRRRDLVLRLMRQEGRISDGELRIATAMALPNHAHGAALRAWASGDTGLYFQEELRRQLFAQFGAERVLRGGLRVYSTYDPDLQKAAERAVTARIAEIVRKRPRARALQGSLVAIDPQSGDVVALVGGRDYHASSFNRATQARRQAGSAFKPIIYAAALERGYAPGSILQDLDSPTHDAGGAWWPSGEHERGEYTLRRALAVSSNRASAQLLQQVGLSTAIYYAHRLGIDSDLPMVPSLALGTGEVTLLELTSAYTAFANNGTVSPPRLMTRVEDSEGRPIWMADPRSSQAITPATAYLMSSMLADAVSKGTASSARAAGFRLPAAGKTGTTDDYADAWFVGYTPHLLAGVWFGFDRPARIMDRGFAGVVAVPAWADFMRSATAGAKPEWYPMPPDVEKVAICRLSGARATDACRRAEMPPEVAPEDGAFVDAMYPLAPDAQVVQRKIAGPMVSEDLFPIGAVPSETCPIHGAAAAPFPQSVETPMVDAILKHSASTTRPVEAPAPISAIRAASPFIVERVLQPDGSYRLVIRQR